MARLSILSNDEINLLYTIPSLCDEERHWLFELDDEDTKYLGSLDGVGPKVNYILQLGYYRAVSYFFRFSFQQVKEDVAFILKHYFPGSPFPKKGLSKHAHYQNRSQVCKKLDLKESDAEFILQLTKEAKRLAKIHVLPKFILTGLLSSCQQKNVIKPAYSKFQDIVSNALRFEQRRLSNTIYTDANQSIRNKLDNLLENEDLLYNLTLLKRDQKNFSTTEIKKTIDKQQMVIDLYQESQTLMKKLNISEQNIIYYASLAEFYTIQKLRTFRSKNQARLYLLCYAHRRLRKINDQLITSLVQKVLAYVKQADEYQKSQIDTVEAVDKQLRSRAYKVMMVNVNDKIPDHLVRDKAFEIVPKEEYRRFLSDFKKPNLERDYHRWQQYGLLAQTIKRNVRPIFKVVEFSCDNEKLSNAVKFLRQHLRSNHSFQDYKLDDVPLDFFPKSLKRFIVTRSRHNKKKKVVDGDRYEFMVYWQLQKGIGDISVHIKDSSGYRALEDELIDIEYWETHKQAILEQLNMPLLSSNIVEILTALEASIESKYKYVNQRISSGENACIKLKRNKTGEVTSWTLPYTPLDDGMNNHFFKKLPTQNISDIARFVDNVTGYRRAFTHLQPRYAKVKPELEIIDACVIANATGIDIKKMIDISDIDGQDLKRTNHNFIRVQTLREASKIIVNQTEKLPIFKEYNLSDYGVHASVDGQKLGTRCNTIKSRHSKKYFGLRKGVVVVTLSANNLPVGLKVIGANEHESHYLLDLVESNTTDVDITAVSGDMHSINRVNFALMHMFGYRFMPRFTQLADKSDQKLVCFGQPEDYSQYVIKPSKKARKAQIISEWDKVLRILASLAMKTTTQSNIVRKLSTTQSTSPTLKALIALDEIVMTDYLLGYIDNEEQRMAVQRSLNRGESYHQLTSTISKVNGGKMLNGRNEIELDISAESIRLIANIIIHHNAIILSSLFEYYSEHDPDKCQEILRWSPIAWRFVNLIGNYEFYKREKAIDIQSIIDKLIQDSEIDFSSQPKA